jgi:hypothetical protein
LWGKFGHTSFSPSAVDPPQPSGSALSGRIFPRNAAVDICRYTLVLAVRAKMCAPAGDNNAADRSPASPARLSGAPVNAVLKLKKAARSVSIHII